MGGTVVISHYVKPPSRAARLLIAKHGAADARRHALREVRSARRARSRMRFTFWTAVVAEIDAHCLSLSRVGPKDRRVEAARETSTSRRASIG
jgi:hypothetical protein